MINCNIQTLHDSLKDAQSIGVYLEIILEIIPKEFYAVVNNRSFLLNIDDENNELITNEYLMKLKEMVDYLSNTHLFINLKNSSILKEKKPPAYCQKCGSYKTDVTETISTSLTEEQLFFLGFFSLFLMSLYSYQKILLIPFIMKNNKLELELKDIFDINSHENSEFIMDNVVFLTDQMSALNCDELNG